MSHNDTTLAKPKTKGYILIIDDDDHRRSTFSSYLENFGYQVKMARDGTEAKSLIDQAKFDIALMDVYLPDYNGFVLLAEIKKAHPILEVIVCTGYSEDYDFFGAVKAGASDWIAKPCNLQKLHAKVERLRREQNHLSELSKKSLELEKIKAENEHTLAGLKGC